MTTITIAVTAIELPAYIAEVSITPVPAVVVGPMFDGVVTNCDVAVTVMLH